MRNGNYKTTIEWRAEGRVLRYGVASTATHYAMVPGTPTGAPLYHLHQTVAMDEMTEVITAEEAAARRHPAAPEHDPKSEAPPI